MPKYVPHLIPHGTNLTECIKYARWLGCRVEIVAGTGDIRFRHALMEKTVTANNRRKDSPRAVTKWLNQLQVRLRANEAA